MQGLFDLVHRALPVGRVAVAAVLLLVDVALSTAAGVEVVLGLAQHVFGDEVG